MTDDLKARLRVLKWMINCEVRGLIPDTTAYEAADRIEAMEAHDTVLEAGIAALRAQLATAVPHKEGFAPCYICGQYSHSIREDELGAAYMHFHSMYPHPVRGHPMGYLHDDKTQAMAKLLIDAIDQARAQVGSFKAAMNGDLANVDDPEALAYYWHNQTTIARAQIDTANDHIEALAKELHETAMKLATAADEERARVLAFLRDSKNPLKIMREREGPFAHERTHEDRGLVIDVVTDLADAIEQGAHRDTAK